MCVMCAYIGKENASSLLWEAGKRIEGLWSGFYSGLGTLYDGNFYMKKSIGYTKDWEKKYNISNFPGNIGFFHSRTNSGGTEEMAHPFISFDQNIMIISQGSMGKFSLEPFIEYGNLLLDNGITFLSAKKDDGNKKYSVLKDSTVVHITEIFTNAVAYEYKELKDPILAIKKVAKKLQEESVTLIIFKDIDNKIYLNNVNQRIVAYRENNGIFLSKTILSSKNINTKYFEFPENCIAEISENSIKMDKGFDELFIENILPENLLVEAQNKIKNSPPLLLAHLTDYLGEKLFKGEKVEFRADCGYETLEIMLKNNLVKLNDEIIPLENGYHGKESKILKCE